MTWELIFSQTTPGAPDAILTWVQYGVLGVVVFALIRGWIWAKPSVDQLLASIARLTAENVILREQITTLQRQLGACEEDVKDLQKDLEAERRRVR